MFLTLEENLCEQPVPKTHVLGNLLPSFLGIKRLELGAEFLGKVGIFSAKIAREFLGKLGS